MGKIKLNDQVEADINYSLSKDAAGKVTGSLQKVLVDTTTGTQENDGDPQDLNPTDDEEAQINAALDAVLGTILNARATAAAAAVATTAAPATTEAPATTDASATTPSQS